MKLELKHLAPYLPYNVESRDHSNTIYRLNLTIENYGRFIGNYADKMILRPLSDLKDELFIELNDKFFIGTIIINDEYSITHFMYELNNGIFRMQFWKGVQIYNWLLSKHFDIFGLIEKGLAIDINTLPVNE